MKKVLLAIVVVLLIMSCSENNDTNKKSGGTFGCNVTKNYTGIIIDKFREGRPVSIQHYLVIRGIENQKEYLEMVVEPCTWYSTEIGDTICIDEIRNTMFFYIY